MTSNVTVGKTLGSGENKPRSLKLTPPTTTQEHGHTWMQFEPNNRTDTLMAKKYVLS